jgi:hypothetical protein
MSQKEVVYHLGAHKTASSLLQKYMRDNTDVLRGHRIAFLGRGEMNDCVGWGKRLLKRPEILGDRLAELLDDDGCDRLVTSHENTLGPPLKPGAPHLYPRGPEIVEQLTRVLKPWRSRAFLYIRPQAEFVESYYLQRIHQGDHVSFSEWLDDLDLDALSWRPVVDALRRHFGPDRVEVVDFGLIRQGQNAFIADFFRRIDPAVDLAPDYRPIRNPSISGKGLRIALAANKHLRSDRERKAMRIFLQRHFSNRDYPRPILFTDEQKTQVRQRYASEYEQLTGGRAQDAGGVMGGAGR